MVPCDDITQHSPVPNLAAGDVVRIEMLDPDGDSLLGAIEQRFVAAD